MNRKKAFTLVELLAVIVILGILALIIYPVIQGTIQNQKKKTFESSMYGILETVKIDISDDNYTYPRFYTYNKGNLILQYVNGIEKNEKLKTNGTIDGSGTIYVDQEGKIIIGAICDKNYCGTNEQQNNTIIIGKNDGTDTEMNPLDPNILINGENPMIIGINEAFVDPGVIAKTLSGEDLNDYVTVRYEKEGEPVDRIDTSKTAEYKVIYAVTSNNKTIEAERIVKVVDYQPSITITAPNEKYVKKETITMTVKPGYGGEVTSFQYKIKDAWVTVNQTTTEITLTETGNYQIEVQATDQRGYQKKIIKGPYKIDQEPPTITFPETTNIKITEISGFAPMSDASASDNSGKVTLISAGELTSTIGEQTITYTATDEAGNKTVQERTITVVEDNGPIINFSSTNTTGWVKNTTVTATATDDSDLSSFTYEITKNGSSTGIQNGTISGNSGTASITLNTTGTYTIHLIGVDKYGNTTELTSGTYQIDADTPSAPTVTGTSTTWAQTRTLTITAPASSSGIQSYEYYVSNATTAPSTSQTPTGTTTSNSLTLTNTAKYVFIRAINQVGTKGTWTAALNLYVDTAAPKITAKSASYSYNSGTSVAVTGFYTATYGISGGSTTCKVGSTTVTNVSTLAVGTNSLVCTATSGAKKTASVTIKVTIYRTDLLIHFDNTTDLNYFTLSTNSNASVSVANSYLTESSAVTDNSINVVLTPAKAGMSDISYIEFKMKKTATTSGVFPFLRVYFADGNRLQYVLMNKFVWSGYTSWWGKALYQNGSSSLWGFSNNAYFCYGDPGQNNDYENNCRENGSGTYGVVCSAPAHTTEAIYKVTLNKSTGVFTIYNGYCDTTVTTEALTTSKVTKIDFNFQDDWFNTSHSSMIDYIRVKN